LKTHNAGNPWEPTEVAKVLAVGARTGNYFYLAAASREYGLTDGGRDSKEIKLTALGKQAVFPASDDELAQAKITAFLNVAKFRDVLDYYKGSALPELEFVQNTLQTKFGLDPAIHDEFLDLFQKNCRYVGIGATWDPQEPTSQPGTSAHDKPKTDSEKRTPKAHQPKATGLPVCFVIMPFVERTDTYSTGFFTEVFASLFKPAIEAAGFTARTAKRQGSDVIQATIVNELLDADLVLCDLTEHNPNVLFELGIRMAEEKPIAIVKAVGTNPIFDVDHLLRVESYDPNLWPSTVVKDVPKLAAHIQEAWESREASRSYMSILRQQGTA
jgi:hypothetical protein